jgi:hypothetical protein
MSPCLPACPARVPFPRARPLPAACETRRALRASEAPFATREPPLSPCCQLLPAAPGIVIVTGDAANGYDAASGRSGKDAAAPVAALVCGDAAVLKGDANTAVKNTAAKKKAPTAKRRAHKEGGGTDDAANGGSAAGAAHKSDKVAGAVADGGEDAAALVGGDDAVLKGDAINTAVKKKAPTAKRRARNEGGSPDDALNGGDAAVAAAEGGSDAAAPVGGDDQVPKDGGESARVVADGHVNAADGDGDGARGLRRAAKTTSIFEEMHYSLPRQRVARCF